MTKQDEIIEMARQAGCFKKHQLFHFTSFELEAFAKLIEDKVEREYADMLTIAHMDGFERGRDAGIKQERALWKLAETSQQIGYDK